MPRVALLAETSREHPRGLLRGIASYHKRHGPWSIYFEPHGLYDGPPPWLSTWQGEGLLVRVNDREMADAVKKTGIPAINVSGIYTDPDIPYIGVDNRPVSALAFAHLRDCGLSNFAFCGILKKPNQYQDHRCENFVELVERAGYTCSVFNCERQKLSSINWEPTKQKMVEWLKQLPKPVGVMTFHDDRGLQVIDACRRAELQVPDEVAIIGVDNDPSICNLCNPPLSSIDINPGKIGFEAAAALGKCMNGGKLPNGPILFGPPRGIVPRQSTDMMAIDDPDVAIAIKYIRDHATEGIRVSDVISKIKNSPSTLERRFKKALGRTLKAEITRIRLVRAKVLLSETNITVSAIAYRTGFNEPKYFCDVFRKNEGTTATTYRNQFRN